MKELERKLKALANRRRLEILAFIKKHKHPTVGEISRHIKISFAATSRHLSQLEKNDILDKTQTSTEVRYFIPRDVPKEVETIIAIL